MSKCLTAFRSYHPTLVRALAALCLAITSLNARAQTGKPADSDAGVKLLAFDVISIKPNKAGEAVIGEGVMGHFTVTKIARDGFTSANITAKALIALAYGLKGYLISGGPNWIESRRYDVEAKVTDFDALNSAQPAKAVNSPQLTKAQLGQMMRALLADRFKLVAHYDIKDAPIYQLVINKGGPKLENARPGDADHNHLEVPAGLKMTHPGQLTGQEVSIASLIDTLTQLLQRPIVDKTGLRGKYVMNLQYTPDTGDATDSPDFTGPSIFTALQQQLGLKLVSSRGPVKTLVIDRIEPPSEN